MCVADAEDYALSEDDEQETLLSPKPSQEYAGCQKEGLEVLKSHTVGGSILLIGQVDRASWMRDFFWFRYSAPAALF